MQIEEIINKIQNEEVKAKTEDHSAEGLIRLQEVASQYDGEYKLVWSDEILEDIKQRPKKVLYETNIPRLDELIGGFREQQLITVSASTKHGKTTFGLFLTEMFEKLNPVVIPLEQSNEEIIEQREENGYTIPKFLSPQRLASKVTTNWIEQRVIEGIAKHNTKFVLVDHLGYIDTFGEGGSMRRENLAFRTGEVMRNLKNVAKRWNVVIVLLVHISQQDEGKPPTMEDIKNSSDIAQESDMIIMLWRKNSVYRKIRTYENKTLVAVMANRRTGRNGNVGLSFNTDTGRYDDDHEWVKAMEEMALAEVEADEKF